MRCSAASRATCTIRSASGISSALAAAERALAVPAIREMDEEPVDRRGAARAARPASAPPRRSPPGEDPSSRCLGQPAGDLQRAGGCRAPRRRKRAHDPGQHLTLRPEGRRDEVLRHRAAEDLRRDVGIRRAAGVHQQARVVGLRGRRAVDPEAVRQPHRDQRAVQALLERKAHPQIGGQAKRRGHLGGTHSVAPRRCHGRHAATVPQGRVVGGSPQAPPTIR